MESCNLNAQSLFDVVKQITDHFLSKRQQEKAKSYVKMDYKIVQGDDYFGLQLTKCGFGHLDLNLLLTNHLKTELRQLEARTKNLNGITVALVEVKTADVVQQNHLVFQRNAFLVPNEEEMSEAGKEFSKLKNYVSVKLLVENKYLEEFSSLMLSYVMHVEQLDSNVKFILRINEKYIYRNHVKMDDVVLSCKILAESCASIWEHSTSDDFRADLMSLMNIKRASDFEKSIGCLLISQADKNFTISSTASSKRE